MKKKSKGKKIAILFPLVFGGTAMAVSCVIAAKTLSVLHKADKALSIYLQEHQPKNMAPEKIEAQQ